MVNGIWSLYAARCTLFPSTTVEQPLQISPFMQNKPNFTRFLAQKRDFAQKQTQFKAKTKPIYRTTKMSVCSTLTTVYERDGIFAARKTKPKQTQFAGVLKMKVSSFLTRSYGDMPALAVRQNKPKQSQFRLLFSQDCRYITSQPVLK